jgi:hypothetical protein
MGNQLIEKNEAQAELWLSFLASCITFEVKPPVDSGGNVKESSLVIRSDKPMADHKIDDHWMRRFKPRKRVKCHMGELTNGAVRFEESCLHSFHHLFKG